MSSPESEPSPVPPPSPEPVSTSPLDPAAPSTSTPSAAPPDNSSRMLTYAVVFGLLAGVIAWIGGEMFFGKFDPTLTLEASLDGTMLGMQDAADTRTSALLYGILGGTIGLVLGIAGGLARPSTRSAVIAGIVGLVVGGTGGYLVSLGVVPHHHRHYDPDSEDLLLPLMIHGAIWATAGVAGGLAFGLGLGAHRRLPAIILGGLVGALLGTAFYEVIGAIAFPLANTVEPMAQQSGARFLACAAVALGTALGAWAALQPPRPKKVPVPATA